MNVRFHDREDPGNPRDGARFADAREVMTLIDELRSRAPAFYELIGDNNHSLLLGIGGELGCAQYSAGDGAPPYLMAVNRGALSADRQYEEFLAGGTLTPVERKYCLPLMVIKDIAREFVDTGRASPSVDWEEI